MFSTEMGGQISWLLPAALIFLVVDLAAPVERGPRPTAPGRRSSSGVAGWS